MIAEDFTAEDYPTICEFWNLRRRPAWPIVFLPPTGIKIIHWGSVVAFGFLVKTDTPMAVICDLITNPREPGIVRDEGLTMLINALEAKARAAGYSAITGSTNHNGLKQRYSKMGYIGTDDGLQVFMKI